MLMKTRYKTSLTASKMTLLLEKIKNLHSLRARALVVKRGIDRFLGPNLSSVAIDETQATGTIEFDAGSKFGVTQASKVIQDLTYSAKSENSYYFNDVTIQYVDPGADSSISVNVEGRKIVVTLAYALGAITSDADEVKAAIETNALANALVSISVSGVGGNLQAEQVETALEGGTSLQTFDKADIYKIVRLRSRKWAIVLNADADPTV